ncbi:MAG TPA: apolipoprotein N-acyltransferase [Mycobacteriales bacterium]|nr:apolipoprotein N-acyltransferase [Mycobacteriales bacterium]
MTGWPLRAPAAALLALAGGGVLYLAFPPAGLRPLAGVAPALLILAVRHQQVRRGAWLGAIFGASFFFPLLSWLQFGGIAPWIAVSVLETLLMAVTGAGLAAVSRLPGWPLCSAAVWVAGEGVRGRVPFDGFTWGRLAFSQDEGPMTRWAAVFGAAGLTFAVALVAALLAAAAVALRRRPRLFGGGQGRRALAFLAAAAVVALCGLALPGPPPAREHTVVALVQGNVPRLGLDFNAQRQRVVRNHVDATLELARRVEAGELAAPDLVLWPENATDIDPRTDREIGRLLTEAARAVNQPILVGAVLDAPANRALNAGIVWDPVTGPGQTYVKRHLVPYGEYVPFRKRLEPIFGQLALIPRDFKAGADPGVLDLNGVRIGDVICFEVAYDDLVHDVVRGGAEILVVQTNNATFGRSAETRQQLAMSRLRAVEHGRAVAVVATSGISAVIGPDGSFVDQSEIFTRDLLVERMPLITATTLATRLGGWPEGILLALGAAAALAGALTRRESPDRDR